eukprot:65750_1
MESILDSSNVNLFRSVPLLVTSLCITYYFIPESFDEIVSNESKLYNNKRNLISNYRIEEVNYGSIIVSSDSQLISEWHVQIKHINGMMNGIDIGISCHDQDNTHPVHYGYYGGGFVFKTVNGTRKWRSFGTKYGLDDVIQMKLDFKSNKSTGILSYYVNGLDQGIAFHNIAKNENLSYKLTIGTTLKTTIIKILKFTQQ